MQASAVTGGVKSKRVSTAVLTDHNTADPHRRAHLGPLTRSTVPWEFNNRALLDATGSSLAVAGNCTPLKELLEAR